MNYWLIKSEPDAFSIDDLKRRPNRTEPWDGIRNYQARNFMRDGMRVGDQVLFYHSSCKPPGIVGIVEIASGAYPDPTQFDPESGYFDPKSDPDDPRWLLVDVRFVRDFKRMVTLEELKAEADSLGDFQLLRRGNRLSILPVDTAQWKRILQIEKRKPI